MDFKILNMEEIRNSCDCSIRKELTPQLELTIRPQKVFCLKNVHSNLQSKINDEST
jgi:hypothetical protein